MPVLVMRVLVIPALLIPEWLVTAWALLWEGDPARLRAWLLGFGIWAPIVSTAIQVLSSLVPILPGFVLGIANAMLYGALLGGLLTFSSALLAATCCFGLARVIGRPGVERIVSRASIARVDAFMERRGMLTVFLGRLQPFINHDVLSYAAGATSVGWRSFLLAMSAGALPSTVVYSLVGAMALEVSRVVVLIVTLAALLPFGVLWLTRYRLRGSREPASRAGGSAPGSDEPGR